MNNELHPGRVRSGVLVDGQEGTPYLACTLTYEEGVGPLIEVVYVSGDPHFGAAQTWFKEHERPPTALWFHDPDGVVTLTGVRWRGYRGYPVTVGRLDARLAIFGRARELSHEYRVKCLRSTIDGLHQFAAFKSITTDYERSDGSWRTNVTIHAKDQVSVQHGRFTYCIRATAPGTAIEGVEFTARGDAAIETDAHAGATVDEHIVAQWPIRALLVLAYGVPLYWREHRLQDDQFPVWMLSGEARAPEFVRLLLQRTARDHEQPVPDRRDFHLPLFQLDDLRAELLLRWLELYADPAFRRSVEPAVEVLNGAAGQFVEPRLTLSAHALEALGYYLDEGRVRHKRLAQQIQRCLQVPGVDWSPLGTEAQVAEALANVTNDMKHPDRGHQPDGVEMGLAADLAILALRLQFAHLLGVDGAAIRKFCEYPCSRTPSRRSP